jgi:hypothetical protein
MVYFGEKLECKLQHSCVEVHILVRLDWVLVTFIQRILPKFSQIEKLEELYEPASEVFLTKYAVQGCQMVCFQTKIPIWVYFGAVSL